MERGVQRRIATSMALTPPSLALPHKEGGEQRLILHAAPDRLNAVRDDVQRLYSPNLFDFGKPFGGRRPASVRSPIQSRRSSLATVQVRPEVSFQVRPSFSLKTLASETPPSL